MVKFNFLRTCNPQEPSWDGGDGDWQEPAETLGRYVHPETWSYVWDWIRGRRKVGFEPARDIDRHIGHLNGAGQQQRLAAIYSLGAMGEPALEPLLSNLKHVEGRNRIEPPYVQKRDGTFEPRVILWTGAGPRTGIFARTKLSRSGAWAKWRWIP